MDDDNSFDVGGFLGRALDTGLGVFRATQQPTQPRLPNANKAAFMDTPPWVKWAAIGAGALVLVGAAVLIFKKN